MRTAGLLVMSLLIGTVAMMCFVPNTPPASASEDEGASPQATTRPATRRTTLPTTAPAR